MNLIAKKSGFTIVEMMVVMSIVAAMSILGISALINAQNYLVADKAAEMVLGEIREAQNKAFSVVTDPSDPTKFPTAWVIRLKPEIASVDFEKQITDQYVSYDKATDSYSQTEDIASREEIFSASGFKPISIKRESDDFYFNNYLYLYYAAPFGKFFATDKNCADNPGYCTQNTELPRNTIVNSAPDSYVIQINYRNAVKKIIIGQDGNAFIAE